MYSRLEQSLSALADAEKGLGVSQSVAYHLHDIFEEILIEELTNNPGEQIDGAKVLAMCMKCFKSIADRQTSNQVVPQMKGLPSQRYGNNPGRPAQ